MTAVLEAHGFGKRYRRRTWALRGVDLTVPEGTITALVGPNGSGKSTLIRAWIGFERATEGRLSTGGIDPRVDRAAAVARVGYVPQSPSLYDNLTIAEHITLATTLRGGFDSGLAAQYIERLSIPLSAVASELSGGEQAQVGLALALGTRGRSSCSTSRSPVSTRWPGASSSTSSSTPSGPRATPHSCRRT